MREDSPSFIAIVLFLLVLFLLGFNWGSTWATNSMRAEAVEAGVARYEADPKTGTTNFVFIKPTTTQGVKP